MSLDESGLSLDDPQTRTRVLAASHPSHLRLGQLTLLVLEGPDRGKRFHVEVGRGRVVKGGRNPANDVVFADPLVSGTHFELVLAPDGVLLRDLDSKNGVHIHGVRVREALLPVDAVFRVGETSFQIARTDTVQVALSTHDHFGELYGDSPLMRETFAELERIAGLAGRLPVLITGETGTGKELVARGLHEASPRGKGPFVVLDCTSLPRELAESQILGHSRGAFTGAVRDYAGVFEQAHGGTLFIDELGELPFELQAKLLRPLERGEVVRIADPSVRKVDVRVISATHRDLRMMISEGRFREDLYYRLAFKIVEMPALRERGEDIVLLARRFVRAICAREKLPPRTIDPAACAALMAARWPGNVRQLKATVECAALTSPRLVLETADLRLAEHTARAADDGELLASLCLPMARARDEFERTYYRALLKRVGHQRGWVNNAARQAGLNRTGLTKALKRLGLYPDNHPDDLDDERA